MPYMNIRITKEGAANEEKAELIKGVTRLLTDVPDNRGVGGESVTVPRKKE
ncbi:MAG: tautomerase family protein [Desulfobacterales bacterium]|nr:tautomerase family protein [Desulfobacterales bacterium]